MTVQWILCTLCILFECFHPAYGFLVPNDRPPASTSRCPSSVLKAREPRPRRCACYDSYDYITKHEMWVHCLAVRLDASGFPVQLTKLLLAGEPERLFIDQALVPETPIQWDQVMPNDLGVRDLLIWDTPLDQQTLPFSVQDGLHLEHSLEHLEMRGCRLNEHSKVQQLRFYSKLYVLDLSRNEIDFVPADWFDWAGSSNATIDPNPDHNLIDQSFQTPFKQLTNLFLRKNQIRSLARYAFRALRRLVELDLSENQLRTIEPDQLPAQGSQLAVLRLSYNLIRYLPPSLFRSLPNLARVHLDYNQLHTIRSEVWLPPKDKQWPFITLLEYSGNPLICDCDLLWLTVSGKPELIEGECSSTNSLGGKTLARLQRDDILEAPDLQNQDCIYYHKVSGASSHGRIIGY